MGVVVQTLIRYVTLTLVLVAGLFLVISTYRQDWMREEVNMKVSSFKGFMNAVKNMTAGITGSDGYLSSLDKIPDDAKVELKTHFGLKKTCNIIQFSGFENPTQLYLPKITWCVGNDIFENPSKYGLPSETNVSVMAEESKALKNAFVCMVIAMLCTVAALIIVIIKPFKWTVPCMLATIVAATCACICVVAALGLIHSKFTFEEDFKTAQKMLRRYSSSSSLNSDTDYKYGYGDGSKRQRRDDGNPGYGSHYTTEGPVSGYRTMSYRESGITNSMSPLASMLQREYVEVFMDLKLNESIGSPLIMAGLAMGCLLLVVILTLVEFYLNRKFGAVEVKYQNVALT